MNSLTKSLLSLVHDIIKMPEKLIDKVLRYHSTLECTRMVEIASLGPNAICVHDVVGANERHEFDTYFNPKSFATKYHQRLGENMGDGFQNEGLRNARLGILIGLSQVPFSQSFVEALSYAKEMLVPIININQKEPIWYSEPRMITLRDIATL